MRYLGGSARESPWTPCLLVSPIHCGSYYSPAGMSRRRRDLLSSSCSTISAQLPVVGCLRNYILPQGELSVPLARISSKFLGRHCRVQFVWYSDWWSFSRLFGYPPLSRPFCFRKIAQLNRPPRLTIRTTNNSPLRKYIMLMTEGYVIPYRA